MSSPSHADHMGLNVGESTLTTIDEMVRVNPSAVTRAQLTICEMLGDPGAILDILDELGIREDYRR